MSISPVLGHGPGRQHPEPRPVAHRAGRAGLLDRRRHHHLAAGRRREYAPGPDPGRRPGRVGASGGAVSQHDELEVAVTIEVGVEPGRGHRLDLARCRRSPGRSRNSSKPVSTLPSAGPLKLSAQTCFHGGAAGAEAEPAADEQPTLTRAGRTLSQAASRRSRRDSTSAQRCPSSLPLFYRRTGHQCPLALNPPSVLSMVGSALKGHSRLR